MQSTMVPSAVLFAAFLGVAVARDYPGMYLQGTDPNVADKCFPKPRCNAKLKYRTIDGSCNNLKFPTWGKVGTAYVRLLPPRYADGVRELPKGLPNARDVSLALFSEERTVHKDLTTAFVAWGQVIAHDTSFSAPIPGVSCCPRGKAEESAVCADIALNPDDPAYGEYNRSCIAVVRTKNTETIGCKIKPRQQLSESTHFLDLSFVYGSTVAVAKSLREGKGGRLKTSSYDGEQFCPIALIEECDSRSDVCYRAGDPRVNQNLELVSLQVVFLREHNRIAKYYEKYNPKWSDEQIFQEARRWNIAQYQKISYYDFLPLLTGSAGAGAGRGLDAKEVSDSRRYAQYDYKVNPSTINLFTAGCYRYLHTLVPDVNRFQYEDGRVDEEVPLKEWFHRPDLAQEKFTEKIVGMTRQPAYGTDTNFASGVHQYLYKMNKEFGDDLEAIDIERGRDHGLPSYTQARQICGSKTGSNYSELFDGKEEFAEKVSALYKSPEDVDFIVGIFSESRGSVPVLGETCSCIVGEQFRRWKVGDRYWFENQGQFTKDELDELRKASLGRLLCDNTDITEVQRYPFWQISDWNPLYPCTELPSVQIGALGR